ncbi:MAG: nucleotide exchange factor GrpE [Patescibacteria group bacterium]
MADISDLTDPTGKPLKAESKTQEVEVNVDYKDRYMRALADYKNLQRQVEEERKVIFAVATAGIIEQLLPMLDMLYQAEVFYKDQGMKMVKDQFVQTLMDLGLKEMDLIGKKFDPHYAEVVDTVDGDENDKIVEVIKRGYTLGDRIVRVAQVKVSKKP